MLPASSPAPSPSGSSPRRSIILSVALPILAPSSRMSRTTRQSSWVPASAESTEVADASPRTSTPTTSRRWSSIDREGGFTEADSRPWTSTRPRSPRPSGVTDAGRPVAQCRRALREQGQNVPRHLQSEDGEVAYLYFVLNFGKDGWNKLAEASRRDPRHRQDRRRHVHLGGFGGQASDFTESFENIDTTVLLAALPGRHHHPALHLPQSHAVAAADPLRGHRQHDGRRHRLSAREVRRPDRQRPEPVILSILVIGAGTDYALLFVARYREELRRHEDRHEAMAFALHRAAPAILASAATVCHRHALPGVRRPQLDRRSRSGPRGRCRRDATS